MQRICSSLQSNGFDVLLVGVKRKKSLSLSTQKFQQKRISIIFEKTFLFYAEYNIKLFFYLLFKKADAICAIDLDTILPCYFVSVLKQTRRVYDAHEIFTEMNEVINNKKVKWFWDKIEQFCVPRFDDGYTVNIFIKEEFMRRYGANYGVIRNLPFKYYTNQPINQSTNQPIIYQGAVNFGRGFEQLIPAMKNVQGELHIYGIGNFYHQVEALIKTNGVGDKVKLLGAILPNDLKQITPNAKLGITIFKREGMNQYYSLANRFFDYIMAGIPQVCVAYPEYVNINEEFEVALLVNDIKPETLSNALNTLLTNSVLYNKLKENTLKAREVLNWQTEEKKLIQFWTNIFT
jgi:glycosyltransferase involved in cell wall biosynthesis